jgi:hypothetical protein
LLLHAQVFAPVIGSNAWKIRGEGVAYWWSVRRHWPTQVVNGDFSLPTITKSLEMIAQSEIGGW